MRFAIPFLAVAVAACSDDLSTDAGTSPVGAATDVQADIRSAADDDELLRAGVYEAVVDGMPVNDCGLLADQLAPPPTTLEWLDDDGFAWVDGPECTLLSSGDYTCYLTTSVQTAAPGVELVTAQHAQGYIIDAETLQEELELTVDCRGPGCADYAAHVGAAFPCDVVMETTPTWRAY